VSIDVRRLSEGVRFEVRDSGPGMTKEEQRHAFDRLWHGRGPGHGSGLGLWIARSLVEAHGGTIQATAQPGKGTTLTFLLPQPDSSAAPQATQHPAGIEVQGITGMSPVTR
ncbi:MAG: two-component sensor histidine kinase, partial [Labilithrix sp.]|nr:two-component sensor histidine kinase [Labilithrix sp.]